MMRLDSQDKRSVGLTVFGETKRNETKRNSENTVWQNKYWLPDGERYLPSFPKLSSLDALFRKIPIALDW